MGIVPREERPGRAYQDAHLKMKMRRLNEVTSKAPFKSKIQFQRRKGQARMFSFCPHHLAVLGAGHQRRKQTILVSSPACKELRSHHSVLTSKKLDKLKNQQLFLDLKENKVTGQTAAPKIGETDKQL